MSSSLDQSRYQVRFEWGIAGLETLAASDVVVVVDVLGFGGSVIDRIDRIARGEVGEGVPPIGEVVPPVGEVGGVVPPVGEVELPVDAVMLPVGDRSKESDGAALAARAGALVGAPTVLIAGLRNAAAVAQAALAEQVRRGARTSIAVVAAGGVRAVDDDGGDDGGREDARMRFAVEDLLGAGAVIDALGSVGIDHTAPEAAAASEAFRGLRGACRHLLTASGSGQMLIERGRRGEVVAAAQVDDTDIVPVLRGDAFEAYRPR